MQIPRLVNGIDQGCPYETLLRRECGRAQLIEQVILQRTPLRKSPFDAVFIAVERGANARSRPIGNQSGGRGGHLVGVKLVALGIHLVCLVEGFARKRGFQRLVVVLRRLFVLRLAILCGFTLVALQ